MSLIKVSRRINWLAWTLLKSWINCLTDLLTHKSKDEFLTLCKLKICSHIQKLLFNKAQSPSTTTPYFKKSCLTQASRKNHLKTYRLYSIRSSSCRRGSSTSSLLAITSLWHELIQPTTSYLPSMKVIWTSRICLMGKDLWTIQSQIFTLEAGRMA